MLHWITETYPTDLRQFYKVMRVITKEVLVSTNLTVPIFLLLTDTQKKTKDDLNQKQIFSRAHVSWLWCQIPSLVSLSAKSALVSHSSEEKFALDIPNMDAVGTAANAVICHWICIPNERFFSYFTRQKLTWITSNSYNKSWKFPRANNNVNIQPSMALAPVPLNEVEDTMFSVTFSLFFSEIGDSLSLYIKVIYGPIFRVYLKPWTTTKTTTKRNTMPIQGHPVSHG